MSKQSMGEYLARLRKSKSLTQAELAKQLSVSNKTVSKWERGDGYPEITLIPVIAGIFGVTCDELLKGGGIDGQLPKKTFNFKPLEISFYVLCALPFVLAVLAIPFLPQSFPMHYDFDGTINRWGSSYEFLWVGGISLLMIPSYIGIKPLIKKRYDGFKGYSESSKQKLLTISKSVILGSLAFMPLIILPVMLVVFADGYSIAVAAYGAPDIDIAVLRSFALLTDLIVLTAGLIMPFVPRSLLAGLRTPVSLRSKKTWKISNIWGGATFAAAGLTTLIVNLIIPMGVNNLYISMTAIGAAMVLLVIQQVIISKKYPKTKYND